MSVASHAGVFMEGMEKRAPLKTPAWEATCLRTKLKASMSRIKDNFPRLTHKSGRIGI